MRKALIEEMSDMYTNIAVMLIESAAVFSVLGIALIVMAARNEPLTFAFSHVWTMFSVELSTVPSIEENLNCVSSFITVSLPANDHSPGLYGSWVAQRN